MAASARGFQKPVPRHPQPPAWSVRIGQPHFDFVVAPVGLTQRLGCEGLVTGRASLRPMIEHSVDGQLLASTKAGRARLPTRATRRGGRRAGRRFCQRSAVVAHLNRLSWLVGYGRRRIPRRTLRRHITLRGPTGLAIDRIASGRTRTVAGVLVQSVPRLLEVSQQALRQPPQRLFLKLRQSIAVELAKIMVGQMHGTTGWAVGNGARSNATHAQFPKNRRWFLSLHR